MGAVKYTGSWTDSSGYGEANRQDILALDIAGCAVTTELVIQMADRLHKGWAVERCHLLAGRDVPYRIKIIHLTPDCYPKYIEPGKYNIGRLFWETDRLPKEWIEPINKMNEIWTSSNAMAQLFRNSGVKVPVYAFAQPIDIAEADKPYGAFNIPEHNGFLFYAMFQWIERKNPKTLLQSYWEEFTGRTDVSLLLKTYRIGYSEEEFEKIRLDIERWKRELNLVHYPRVLLCTKLLNHDEVMKLHNTGDCYISADHGEGWSRPLQEALLMGKPVVSTARGGLHEYLDESMYYPVSSTYVPVIQQNWIPWYTSDQNWAQIDKEEFKKKLRFVFLNSPIARMKTYKAKEFIKTSFCYQALGDQMKKRLSQIERAL